MALGLVALQQVLGNSRRGDFQHHSARSQGSARAEASLKPGVFLCFLFSPACFFCCFYFFWLFNTF